VHVPCRFLPDAATFAAGLPTGSVRSAAPQGRQDVSVCRQRWLFAQAADRGNVPGPVASFAIPLRARLVSQTATFLGTARATPATTPATAAAAVLLVSLGSGSFRVLGSLVVIAGVVAPTGFFSMSGRLGFRRGLVFGGSRPFHGPPAPGAGITVVTGLGAAAVAVG
jgi:hypothetical protein